MPITRRKLLQSTPALLAGFAKAEDASGLYFEPIEHNNDPALIVPAGYQISLVIQWGAPLSRSAPEFDVARQTGATQSQQFGYNCDHLEYFSLPDFSSKNSRSGILTVNHESTVSALIFPGYRSGSPTKDQVDAEMAAVGLSVVEVRRTSAGVWEYDDNSIYNRRITGETVFDITGPAAGDDMMKTSYDPAGRRVRGTWANCAGGRTPWGTALSGEEGAGGYFANRNSLPNGALKDLHTRYGVSAGASGRRWENFHDRMDAAKEPNEANRFGWVVEVDPYNPNTPPKKRTALGRMAHEGATCRVAADGRVTVYTGDDARFEYVYKFVTSKPWNPNNRSANADLLDEGTLYVARFNEDNSGDWLPLVWGQGPLTEANGFRSQAEVLIKTRLAADLLGATKMDRPEDIEASPVTGKVYIVCTSNNQRTATGTNAVNAANPRVNNLYGHILELVEVREDSAATAFRCNVFMLCGNPRVESHRPTYYGGYDQTRITPVANPDNLMFDSRGNMWIATDGMDDQFGVNDGLFGCPVEGAQRGFARLFLTVPPGAETTGPELTPDDATLFIAVQHPGEGGTLGGRVVSNWPFNSEPPRPGVIAITKASGASDARIGM